MPWKNLRKPAHLLIKITLKNISTKSSYLATNYKYISSCLKFLHSAIIDAVILICCHLSLWLCSPVCQLIYVPFANVFPFRSVCVCVIRQLSGGLKFQVLFVYLSLLWNNWAQRNFVLSSNWDPLLSLFELFSCLTQSLFYFQLLFSRTLNTHTKYWLPRCLSCWSGDRLLAPQTDCGESGILRGFPLTKSKRTKFVHVQESYVFVFVKDSSLFDPEKIPCFKIQALWAWK